MKCMAKVRQLLKMKNNGLAFFSEKKNKFMKQIKYEFDRPLSRLEMGDIAEISVSHFPDIIVKEKDRKKYGHIPNGIYKAVVIEPYKLKCADYPELSGYYNYWRGDKRACSDGIYANEVGKSSELN